MPLAVGLARRASRELTTENLPTVKQCGTVAVSRSELTPALGRIEFRRAGSLAVMARSGAIGIDWFSAGEGCVSWLISWPRKKLIKRQLPTSSLHSLPRDRHRRLRNPRLRSPKTGHKFGLVRNQDSLLSWELRSG